MSFSVWRHLRGGLGNYLMLSQRWPQLSRAWYWWFFYVGYYYIFLSWKIKSWMYIMWALQDLDSDLSPSSLSSTRHQVQQALLTGGLPSIPCLQNLSETNRIAQGYNACLAFVRSWCDPQNTHAHTHNLRNPNNVIHIFVMQRWEWPWILWYVS